MTKAKAKMFYCKTKGLFCKKQKCSRKIPVDQECSMEKKMIQSDQMSELLCYT